MLIKSADIGQKKYDLFSPIDLFEEKHIPKVINTLLLLEYTARYSTDFDLCNSTLISLIPRYSFMESHVTNWLCRMQGFTPTIRPIEADFSLFTGTLRQHFLLMFLEDDQLNQAILMLDTHNMKDLSMLVPRNQEEEEQIRLRMQAEEERKAELLR